MDTIKRFLKKIIIRFALFPLLILPIKDNRVLIINDLSGNYSGNPKAVAECLNHKYNLINVYYAVKNSKNSRRNNIKFIKYKSLKYFFIAMTSKAIITNSGGISFIPLRKKQFVINTWHGGGAYKKIGIHMYNESKIFKKDLMLSVKNTSLFLSSCRRFTEIACESLLYKKDIFWEIGMPRNDILINGDEQLKKNVRKSLGLKDGEKLVLYAPTYRKPNDNYFKNSIAISYGIDCKKVCKALEKRFGGKWIFAMRLHPCIIDKKGVIPKDAIDLTDYEDMQELLLASDVMINDFSSSMWDFMLTGKPSFMYAVDLQHYIDTTEVYTSVEDWPFPKSTSNDELIDSIVNFDEEKYKKNCKKHYEALGGCETGHACEMVCKRIAEVCGLE